MSDSVMQVQWGTFMAEVEKRRQAIDKIVKAEIRKQLQPVINQLLREPVESTNWRLDRAVRRIIRRDILRDVRYRNARWRKRFRGKRRKMEGRYRLRGVYGLPVLMHPDKLATVRVDP